MEFVTVVPARIPFVKAELATSWEGFFDGVCFDDDSGTLSGKKSVFLTIADGERIDFTKLHDFPGREMVTAILRGKVRTEVAGYALFGTGADYWLKVVINGKTVFSTASHGNGGGPSGVKNLVFKAELPAGESEILFYVGSGSCGWSGALGTLEPTPAHVSYLDRTGEIETLFPPETRLTHGPWISHLSMHGTSIHFTTAGNMAAAVDYRKAGETKFRRLYSTWNGHLLCDRSWHEFHLKNLEPDTVYQYRIALEDPASGKEVLLPELHRFSTFPEKPEPFHFVSLGDTHVIGMAKYDLFEEFYKLPEFSSAAFFAHLGDMSGNFEHFDHEILDGMMDFFSARKLPFLPVHGNHEYCGRQGVFWNRYFCSPEGYSYNFIRHGETAILAVDFTNGRTDPEHFDGKPFKSFCTELKQQQREWLRKVFASPEYTTATFRIVLNHSPNFCHGEHFPVTEEYLREFLSGQKIHLFLSGHIHHYQRICAPQGVLYHTFPQDDGVRDKTEYPFPIVSLDGGERLDQLSCGIVSVDGDRLTFTAKNAAGEVIDRFTVAPDGTLSDEHPSPMLFRHRL